MFYTLNTDLKGQDKPVSEETFESWNAGFEEFKKETSHEILRLPYTIEIDNHNKKCRRKSPGYTGGIL